MESAKAFRNNTSFDIREKRGMLSKRQRVIEEKLLQCHTSELASMIHVMVEKNCNGCLIHHPSQRQHDCLMMENEEQMLLYFDDALENVSEHDVLRCFMKSLEEIEPSVNGLEVLNYTYQDWRQLFCSTWRGITFEARVNKQL